MGGEEVINIWSYRKAIIIVVITTTLFLDVAIVLPSFYAVVWKVPGVSFGVKLLLASLVMLLVLLVLKVKQLVAIRSLLDTCTVPACLGNKSCIDREECSRVNECNQVVSLLSKRHRKCELVVYLVSDYSVVRDLARTIMKRRFSI